MSVAGEGEKSVCLVVVYPITPPSLSQIIHPVEVGFFIF